uniref:Prefoldin subunit 3 n=1 Tax=Chlamydomonas euryale TaxID=1486919 RepID=A0A7R9VP95_9CHLO|mmetsp:Transcript_413/g.1130  ORF Transcript_413/g.1130 Transcript_413/m.1130 type:complete len:188 (+) Transcript_413:120-683(+)
MEKMEKLTKEEVPVSEFIDDVPAFVATAEAAGKTPDVLISGFQDRLKGLKLLEQTCMQRKQRLLGKLPEMDKALAIVKQLLDADGSAMSIDFELSPHVYTVAKVQDVKTVNLWLGAGVMVEYELEEARQLLEANLATCKLNLSTANSDIDMIKESTTTTEVSIARIFNYDVERRRKAKEVADAEAAA